MLDVNNKSTRYEVDSTKDHSKSQVCVPRGNIFIFMLYACVRIETHVAEKSKGRVSRVCWISVHYIVLYCQHARARWRQKRDEKGRGGNEGREHRTKRIIRDTFVNYFLGARILGSCRKHESIDQNKTVHGARGCSSLSRGPSPLVYNWIRLIFVVHSMPLLQ